MGERPTSELVALIFTATLCICLVAAVVGIVVVRIVQPGTDVSIPASSLGTLLSALAGYVIGANRRRNGNGH